MRGPLDRANGLQARRAGERLGCARGARGGAPSAARRALAAGNAPCSRSISMGGCAVRTRIVALPESEQADRFYAARQEGAAVRPADQAIPNIREKRNEIQYFIMPESDDFIQSESSSKSDDFIILRT
jgi:hypothetical protein